MRSPRKPLFALPLLLMLTPGCVRHDGDGSRAMASPCASAGNQIIDVGPDGALPMDCVDATISKHKGHRVVWQSPDDTKLDIVFRVSPPPLRVRCKDNTCKSDPVAKAVEPNTYEYDTKVAPAAPPTAAFAPLPTPTPTHPATYGRIIIQR